MGVKLDRHRYGCQRCTLAVAQHSPSLWPSLSARGRSIFGKYLNAHLKFTVYGRKQASKHVRTYVNTLLQCSPASVGLAQARPASVGLAQARPNHIFQQPG